LKLSGALPNSFVNEGLVTERADTIDMQVFYQWVTSMSKRWWFTENGEAGRVHWEWRLLADDGNLERRSREFTSYGEAVRDAIIHGFRPTDDSWAIQSTHMVTQYEQGRQTAVTPSQSGKQGALSERKRST
jgi:hypothetical protein